MIAGAPEPHAQGDFAGSHHADRHGFAVQIGAIAAECFHHMAQGVAVIEDGPQSAFPLIGGHHLGLGASGTPQDVFEQGRPHRRLAGEPGGWISQGGRFKLGEQGPITDHPVLDHLGHASPELPLRQGCEGGWIDQHQPGLMEGSDQVLAAGVVHARFAADGGIHHRQQGGGHLHNGDAPQPGGGGKAGHIPHHATTEGNDQGAPFEFLAEGGIMNLRHRGRGFLGFTGFNHQQARLQS